MPTEVIVGLFTLGGVALGFGGQWFLERRKERRAQAIVLSSVMLEMALLQSTLESAVLEGQRRREELRRDFWDRYGPELVNYLPDYLLKALYLLYVDSFEIVAKAYSKVAEGVDLKDMPAYGAVLLSWAYQVDRLLQLIQQYRRTRGLQLTFWRQSAKTRRHLSSDERFQNVVEELERYATQQVKARGFPTEGLLHID